MARRRADACYRELGAELRKRRIAANYTCWSLARYDATVCDFKRLNADEVDLAILDALANFYRTHHDLIQDAIIAEQAQHRAAHADRHAELATVETEITKTGQAIDRFPGSVLQLR